MLFNLNEKVRVKLTNRGRELIVENHNKLFGAMAHQYKPREIKEDCGWSEWQLWDLMHEFGSHLHNGCEVPFETEIDIIEPEKVL